jgi:hypothetical protein
MIGSVKSIRRSSIIENANLWWLFQLLGQQFLAMAVALDDEELKSKNIKGLMAELDTMETPMIVICNLLL